MTSLAGQIALVTGGGAGLGQAISVQLGQAGATVAVIDLIRARRERPLTGFIDGRHRAGVRLRRLGSHPGGLLLGAVARDFGRLDIVVNNAGVSFVGPHIMETTDEAWHTSIEVMQTGVFYGMRAAARLMIPQGSGSVVNISSIRGFSPNPGRIAYCAAKAAVLMMTRVAAGEWGPHGVRANAVAPGVQKTPMWDADVARGAIDEEAILRVVPAGTLGDPQTSAGSWSTSAATRPTSTARASLSTGL